MFFMMQFSFAVGVTVTNLQYYFRGEY